MRRVAAAAIVLAACGEAETPMVDADFQVRAGVETATVVGAEPGAPLTLYSPEGEELLTIVADDAGQAHFAYVPDEPVTIDSGDGTRIPIVNGDTLAPADGYTIRNDDVEPVQTSDPFKVLAIEDVPDTSLYDKQVLTGVHTAVLGGLAPGENEGDGFQFIEVRDGVKLSVMVRFPDPNLYGEGPYPTVVEYSGYSTSKPSGPEPGSMIANLLGYATVGVNMRGTGCSGGVFDVFNPAQHADGYDVIETVARQDWVLHNKVGMVGLSYSGIAQVPVASTQPPSLSAITPLSTIADPWEMQWPGGIYNKGFTKQWLNERDNEASVGGMDWVSQRVDGGDQTCADNLVLRTQNIDFETFLHGLEYRPRDADARSLPLLAEKITVPVYQTGAFQDEQTGAQFTGMLDHYEQSPATKFILYNGRHPDGYSPMVLTRWFEFLEFYVARRVPRIDPVIRAAAGPEFSKAFGAKGLGFEDDRFADFDDSDYKGALAKYESEPRVRVLFESGAGNDQPGAPVAAFETSFPTWPPPDAQANVWYLDASEGLTSDVPAAGADSFRFDPAAGDKTFFGPKGYELTALLWDLNWTEFPEGDLLSYVTEPFDHDVVLGGPGYADLWVQSEVEDASLQVTLSEVRPDGVEYMLQSGWLRLGHRKEAASPDRFRIARTYSIEDFEPMPVGEPVHLRIAIPSVAAALRAGSSLRMTISTPGRNCGTWEFEAPEYDSPPSIRIDHGGEHASFLMMPTIGGVDVTPDLPPCPGLRGQPCRDYRPVTNTPG